MQTADTIEPLLTSAEVAAIFRWSPQTLKLKRRLGLAPASLRIGGRVCFRRTDVAAFLCACAPAGAPPQVSEIPPRPSQAPQFGEPFEPHITGLRCRDGHPFSPVHFALGCPLALAVDALMVEAATDWLRATLPDLYTMLWLWGHSETDGWPERPTVLASALVEPRGQLAADLRRLGIAAERSVTPRGASLDLIRVAKPSERRRYPGQGRAQ